MGKTSPFFLFLSNPTTASLGWAWGWTLPEMWGVSMRGKANKRKGGRTVCQVGVRSHRAPERPARPCGQALGEGRDAPLLAQRACGGFGYVTGLCSSDAPSGRGAVSSDGTGQGLATAGGGGTATRRPFQVGGGKLSPVLSPPASKAQLPTWTRFPRAFGPILGSSVIPCLTACSICTCVTSTNTFGYSSNETLPRVACLGPTSPSRRTATPAGGRSVPFGAGGQGQAFPAGLHRLHSGLQRSLSSDLAHPDGQTPRTPCTPRSLTRGRASHGLSLRDKNVQPERAPHTKPSPPEGAAPGQGLLPGGAWPLRPCPPGTALL